MAATRLGSSVPRRARAARLPIAAAAAAGLLWGAAAAQEPGSAPGAVDASAANATAKPAWPVPRAEAACAAGCAPAVFVVATGRSGSTTVMDMLNAIPGYEVMGENGGLWMRMYEAHAMVEENKQAVLHRGNCKTRQCGVSVASKDQTLGGPWRGRNVPEDERGVLCALRVLLYSYVPAVMDYEGAKAWGFKEIRWDFGGNLSDARLLSRVVPCAKFVLNYRESLEGQMTSAFWKKASKKDAAATTRRLEAENAAIAGFLADLGPDRAFSLPLESFSLERYNELLEFLGEGHCTYKRVVHANDNNMQGARDKPKDVVECSP